MIDIYVGIISVSLFHSIKVTHKQYKNQTILDFQYNIKYLLTKQSILKSRDEL